MASIQSLNCSRSWTCQVVQRTASSQHSLAVLPTCQAPGNQAPSAFWKQDHIRIKAAANSCSLNKANTSLIPSGRLAKTSDL